MKTFFRNLGDAFAPEAKPDSLALIDLADGVARQYSYAELQRRIHAAARGFVKRGLKPGDSVGILAANRAEFLIAFYATMQAGMISVPVNYKMPAATVEIILRDCGAKLVLADAERMALVPAGVPALRLDAEGEGSFAGLMDDGDFTAAAVQPHDPAMFLYTSGSTGRPKGVVLSHQSHLWVMDIRRAAGRGPQRPLVAAPLYHMNALSNCQSAHATAGTVVLLPVFTAKSYIEAAATYRVSMLTSVPTMIAMMLREHALLAARDLSSVKGVFMGSAPLTQELLDQARALFPEAQVSNGYGTTESGPVAFAPHPDGIPTPGTSVGVAHPAVEIRLMRDGADVPDEGVMQIRCPALMNGYHNLPEATAKALTEDGFYNTGDVFARDELGFFSFVGRADDMFVCGGENIYPGEVEAMLARHPGVSQVCVVAVPDELKGHKPVAFIVPRPGFSPSEDEIKQFALANAPAYQHPRRVWFLPEMPLAGTNKIDRKALTQQALQPA